MRTASNEGPMVNRQPEVISSLQNPRIKGVLRLRSPRERRKTGLFLIDGPREIEAAVRAGVEVLELYVADETPIDTTLRERVAICQPVSPRVMERLSYGERCDLPVAVARTPAHNLLALKLSERSLLLILDRIEKPGNLGACLRTAVAVGVDAVILNDPICELYNPNTIRASRGAVFQIPVAVAETEELIDFAVDLGIRLWTARVDGASNLWDCDFTGGTAIVFGNEAHGLGSEWTRESVSSFRIPMRPSDVDSLNVSTSAAVTLYEALRQRSETFDAAQPRG